MLMCPMSTPAKQQPIQADKDSLAAMDALLQMGQGTLHDSASKTKNSRISNEMILPKPAPPTILYNENVANRFDPTSNLVATINSLLPFPGANIFFNSNGHHAIAALAAKQVAEASASAASAVGQGSNQVNRQCGPPSIGSPIPFPAKEAPRLVRESPNVTFTRVEDTTNEAVRSKRSDSVVSCSSAIRIEKVEEALRSKPQRGRKRDDLSEYERVELTRTRNREHAKSTRIRKKARYQELLDREEAYLKMHDLEILQDERKNCILDLISLRQKMLINHLRRLSDDHQSGGSPYRGPASHTESPSEDLPKIRQGLSVLVADISSFQFDSLLPGGASPDSEEALAKMLEWDEALASRFINAFASELSDILSSLNFEIESGVDGIAYSNSNLAFCRLELYAKVPSALNRDQTETQRILSGICAFRFGEESSRLISMQWTALDDQCFSGFLYATPTSVSSDTSIASTDRYKRQLVHPSVVSLDHVRNTETEESQGLGLSI